jgi:DNA replication initiation complex subunit (GINS family)|tara:strand:- start:2534 stop:3088 length:555 start_codon:yes stop_codon:yes gene_type:complete
MITFNDIYEASRKEIYSEKLQPISENFILDVAEYLKEKKEMSSKKEDVFSDVVDKTKKQLENAITLFRELMNRRRKKILSLILIASETGISKKDFDNMLDFEKILFENLMKSIDFSDKTIKGILNGKNGEDKEDSLKITFKENVEEFVNLDGKVTGPFEKGQTADISEAIARILIESEKAEISG